MPNILFECCHMRTQGPPGTACMACGKVHRVSNVDRVPRPAPPLMRDLRESWAERLLDNPRWSVPLLVVALLMLIASSLLLTRYTEPTAVRAAKHCRASCSLAGLELFELETDSFECRCRASSGVDGGAR